MSTSLLNRAAVRRYILDNAQRTRPGWTCTRVSAEGMELIEARLRKTIRQLIHGHPTVGQTFRP